MPVYTSSIEVTADYPTIKPSLNLNFARSRSLDPRITFTRASVGTYVGRDGLIKTAGDDEARFDHDPVTLESLGLLIEESRTNSQTNSQPQSGSFTGGDATITYNTATAPNGETEACRIARNGTTASGSFWRATRSITFNANSMVLSCWAKAQDGNNYFVWSFQNLGGAIVRAGFLLTGDGETSIITNGNGGHTLQIEKYPDGWYRCIIIGNTQSVGTTTQFLYTASAYSEGSSAIGGSTLVWGFQLEEGSFPTSYIPTSGSSVTRAADFATLTGESFSSWFNPSESTLYASVSSRGSGGGGIVGIDSSSGVTYLDPIYSSTNIIFYGSGAPVNTPRSNTGKDKVIQTWNDTGDIQTSTANGAVVQSNPITNPISPTLLSIGRYSYAGGNFFNGRVSEVRYYPKALTNAQLQLLTS